MNFSTKKISKTKTLSAIAIILMLTLTACSGSLQLAKCLTSSVQPSAFIGVAPSLVGVGQSVSVTMWLEPFPANASDLNHGLTVVITLPDGSTTTEGPITTAPSATADFVYVPEKVGNYTFQMFYPGETFADTGQYYDPANSSIETVVVQQNPITYGTSQTPLPTGYWQNPINSMNQNWNTISGNWLTNHYNNTYNSMDAVGVFDPYTTAPLSAHIVWTSPLDLGGLAGGSLGSTAFYAGFSYEAKLYPPIIMDGILYIMGRTDNPGFGAFDLRTGKELWWQPAPWVWNPSTGASATYPNWVTNGEILNFDTSNQVGAIAYLWSIRPGTFTLFSASTGDMIEQFTGAVNGTSQTGVGVGTVANTGAGTVYYQPNGELDVYTLDGINNQLYMWNSTLALQNSGQFWSSESGVVAWRPQAGVHPWSAGLQFNVTTPAIYGQSLQRICGNDLISIPGIGGYYTGASGYGVEYTAYSLTNGAVLWSTNHTTQFDSADYAFGDGVYVIHDPVASNWDCYSLTSGALIWTSPQLPSWGDYVPHTPVIAYGCLYAGTYDGYLYCYNITNGQIIWASSSGPDYGETPYGDLPMWYGPIIADNVVFMGTGDHENGAPLPKNEMLFAFNAATGQQLWNISGEMALAAIADGYLLAQNGDDNQAYCFGQGQSATTVMTSSVYNSNSQVSITGTVTDQSPGQTCLGIPAAGTPAISDTYMSQWMEYLYMQQPEPTNAIGVPVTLTDIDPNGNYETIGTTTSDINGQYSYTFTPNVPGTYVITATFGGSNSYFASTAQTIMTFNMPTAATAAPTATPTSVADMYFVPAVAAILVVLIIIGIVLALLMLRKRP